MERIIAVIGPTASGKSAKAVELALALNGEVISVDSRQVYRTLDIGTEKISSEEMRDIPHHLIDIREPEEVYSAGEFVTATSRLITDITSRGKVPILAGGSHFYFDALIHGIPEDVPKNDAYRVRLENRETDELFSELQLKDPERAVRVDPRNRRRIVRALEIVEQLGQVPPRKPVNSYDVAWEVVDLPKEELRERLERRLATAFERGLVEEVARVRERVGDRRLDEFGLEYRVIGEYLRSKREEEALMPALLSKLWQYARRQKIWIRRLVG